MTDAQPPADGDGRQPDGLLPPVPPAGAPAGTGSQPAPGSVPAGDGLPPRPSPVPPAPGSVPAAGPTSRPVRKRPGTAPRRTPPSRGRSGATRRHSGGPRRIPIVVVIVGLLVLGGLIDRTGGGSSASAGAAPPPVPAAAPADALSSSWFCAGATDDSGGPATGTIVIANTQDRPLSATVQLIPSQGAGATSTVSVAARGRTSVPETLPGAPPWIGADVTLDGGAAAVEQQVSGRLGTSATPCATSGSQNWYFTGGRTAVNAADDITLLNPYPVGAIVDMTFTTEQGLEAPGQFQAVVVPASSLVTVDLGSHLRRRTRIATAVTARSGRIVAWQTQVVTPDSSATSIDPADPVPGMAVNLGVADASTHWAWPDGIAGNGVDEQYQIYNPSPATATVQLSLNLDQGSAEPFTLTVGPEEVSTVVSDQQARVPPGVTHSATVRSVNGVPVVAERTVAAQAPSSRTGIGVMTGEQVAVRSWLFAAGSASAASDEWLVLFNPGTRPAQASIDNLGGAAPHAVPGLASVLVPAGGRVAVQINAHAPSLSAPLSVQASQPLYVERDLYGAHGALGYGLSTGVPLF